MATLLMYKPYLHQTHFVTLSALSRWPLDFGACPTPSPRGVGRNFCLGVHNIQRIFAVTQVHYHSSRGGPITSVIVTLVAVVVAWGLATALLRLESCHSCHSF